MQTVKKASHTTFFKMNAASLVKLGVESKRILRVAGLCVGLKEGETSYGPYIGFVGNFTLVNPDTGETIKAASLFLPDVATMPLAAAVKMGGTPQFAFDVLVSLDEKSPVGYSYSIVDLLPQENDPIAALLSAASVASPLALEAPKAPAESTGKGKGKGKGTAENKASE